jgi:hypothetical protein
MSSDSVLVFSPAGDRLTTLLLVTSMHGQHKKRRSLGVPSNCFRANMFICEAVTY